jgi:hypothetical protein
LKTRQAASIKAYGISDWLISLKTPSGSPWLPEPGTGTRVLSPEFSNGDRSATRSCQAVRDFKSIRDEGIIRWLDEDEENKLRAVMEADVAKHDPVRHPILR